MHHLTKYLTSEWNFTGIPTGWQDLFAGWRFYFYRGMTSQRPAVHASAPGLTCRGPLWHSSRLIGANVAQLAEHRIRNATVISSNLIVGSIFFSLPQALYTGTALAYKKRESTP